MAVTFDGLNLLIILDNTNLNVNVETDLYSDWKEWALLTDNLKFPPAFRSVGGDPLTPGIDLGATFFLQNQDGWRIKPGEASETYLLVGNLAPEDSTLPLTVPTDGAFTVLINGLQPVTQNVDSILTAQQNQVTNLQFLIESMRKTHSGFGNILYYDPVNGNDINSGITPSLAVKTFARAHTLASDHSNDIIFILNDSAALITITERFNITKNNIHIRGSGSDILVSPTDDVADSIIVSGAGCSLSSFTVETTAAGTPRNAIFIDGISGGERIELSNITIPQSTNHGVQVTEGNFHEFQDMFIRNCAGDGINILDAVDMAIRRTQVELCTGWGFQVLSTDATTKSRFVRFSNCMTHHNGPGGLNIGTNSFMTIIDVTNYFAIASGNDLIVDGGVATHNDLDERGVFDIAGQLLLIQQMLAGRAEISLDNQTITVYEPDAVTVLATFSISVDGRIRLRTS